VAVRLMGGGLIQTARVLAPTFSLLANLRSADNAGGPACGYYTNRLFS
jgi:hypothetical protein